LRNRMFRNTLICHDHQRPSYTLSWERLLGIQVATALQPQSPQPQLVDRSPEEFRVGKEVWVRTAEPIMKAAIVCMAEHWPRAVPLEESGGLPRQRLDGSDRADQATADADRGQLGKDVLTFYAGGSEIWLQMWLQQPEFATRVSDRPLASPLARLQAAG